MAVRQQSATGGLLKSTSIISKAPQNDVVGTAHGEAYGSIFHWTYTLALSPGNSLKDVYMDQWMYLQDDGSMVNRAAIRKLGLTVAMVTEHFRRLPD